MVIRDGILWRLQAGATRRDIPERYGPWQTCYERLTRWDQDGTWARLLEEAQVKDDSIGNVEWSFTIGSTIAQAHQHVAGARKRGRRGRDDGYEAITKRQPLDRSRAGLTTKLHLITDACGLPMTLHLTRETSWTAPRSKRPWPSRDCLAAAKADLRVAPEYGRNGPRA
ncbi:transposase [Nonomuraea sp. NPDC048901]|uniref:transposase n=1 Tax=Nonomuraea sp. NPDC048901 TaxID=3155627 RepID=UPI0033C2B24C